jgi:cell division protein FtsL
MNEYLCHDFKSPRTDTSRRLPSSFRAIPIIFYVALVGCAYVMTMDYFNYKKALKQKTDAEERQKVSEEKRDALKNEKSDLESEATKAEKVAQWMEGARNIQPIAVKIARAVQSDTRITQMALERSEQVPANLALTIHLNGAKVSTELAAIEAALGQLLYRSYSPQQTKNGDVVEYHSTLVRQAD